jgi:flagellar basal-body rod modification protein FlgD
MPAIASINSLNAASPSKAASGPPPGQIDFMKLLMTQLRNQNPMDPQNGTEFMGQVAQFSQLEGINKLNQNFSEMLLMQNLTQGTNLIGKTVVYDKDGTGATARGVASAVAVNNGKIHLMIGGNAVALSQIRTIEGGTK